MVWNRSDQGKMEVVDRKMEPQTPKKKTRRKWDCTHTWIRKLSLHGLKGDAGGRVVLEEEDVGSRARDRKETMRRAQTGALILGVSCSFASVTTLPRFPTSQKSNKRLICFIMAMLIVT